MKCPHCNGEHPDEYQFCPMTGKEIPQLPACSNPDCAIFGKHILPLEAKFCPSCGQVLGQTKRTNPISNRIEIFCLDDSVSIQIGQKENGHKEQGKSPFGSRTSRIRLKPGLNVIKEADYHDLKFGFSFSDGDNAEKIKEIDLSNFDTSYITDMSGMFYRCRALKKLDLSNFNTSNVTDMSGMFWGCRALELLDLSNFNTSNVFDMSWMFFYCHSLKSLDISGFDTSNVITMSDMFSNCLSLTVLNLSNFDFRKVEDRSHMFEDCTAKKYLPKNFFA